MKEFWIIPAQTRLQDHEIWETQPGLRNSPDRFTHVIEYSAYQASQAELTDLRVVQSAFSEMDLQLTQAQELCREIVGETTLAIKKYEDAPENYPEDNHLNAINCLDEIEVLITKARETIAKWEGK